MTLVSCGGGSVIPPLLLQPGVRELIVHTWVNEPQEKGHREPGCRRRSDKTIGTIL